MFQKSFIYSALLLILPVALSAQTETSTPVSVYHLAFDSVLAKLNQRQLAVYTGKEYYPYFIKPESRYAVTSATSAGSRQGEHPFFISEDFRPESIDFEGVVYRNIPLAYDICRSEVVVLNPARKAMILPEKKVKKFNYAGHEFKALEGVVNLKEDFYDILFWSDSTILCAKRRKNQSELWRTVSDYYIILNNTAYPVSLVSTKSVGVKPTVLRILADEEDQIRAYIRENKIKFSKAKKEESLIKVVQYYASLKTK